MIMCDPKFLQPWRVLVLPEVSPGTPTALWVVLILGLLNVIQPSIPSSLLESVGQKWNSQWKQTHAKEQHLKGLSEKRKQENLKETTALWIWKLFASVLQEAASHSSPHPPERTQDTPTYVLEYVCYETPHVKEDVFMHIKEHVFI